MGKYSTKPKMSSTNGLAIEVAPLVQPVRAATPPPEDPAVNKVLFAAHTQSAQISIIRLIIIFFN